MQRQILQRAWNLLSEKSGVSSSLSSKWFEKISDKYSEKWRHYHTLNHIDELLAFSNEYQAKLKNTQVVNYAIWFHDVVYDPKSNQNEKESIRMFDEFVSDVKADPQSKPTELTDIAPLISKYIIRTEKHKLEGDDVNDQDLQLFLDFDVAILGKADEGYKLYASQIRNEYIHYPWDAYQKGRTAVLKKLKEGHIFQTQLLQNRFEQQAKKNMDSEIELINSSANDIFAKQTSNL